MRLIVGTSGYSYKEWKGHFYPEDLPAAKMLEFYGQHFGSVEINNTFYRLPDGKTLAKWATQVPDDFTFVLKASQRITHQKRLAGCADDVRYFYETAAELGPKLGPVLFQLPPYFRKDAAKLGEFLELLPRGHKAAFEFRHDSWLDEEIFSLLRSRDAALCASDTDEVTDPAALIVSTGSWGYLRLRRTEYDETSLAAWRARLAPQPWDATYVFFKHEDEGKGPAFAKQFIALA
ncbi:MAG TPA: DUF72 domain-containing protein [Thermoanaerobaculia bacterium]|nr:DUF72 domain-containing protein [Thermoanaerobaculia bacterium]